MDNEIQRRKKLQAILHSIVGTQSDNRKSNAHFSPDKNVKLEYPCIIYNRYLDDVTYADDLNYSQYACYRVQVITRHPDDMIANEVLNRIKMSRIENRFIKDNLLHTNIILYY